MKPNRWVKFIIPAIILLVSATASGSGFIKPETIRPERFETKTYFEDKAYDSYTLVEVKQFQGSDAVYLTFDYMDHLRVVVLDLDLNVLKAYILKDGQTTAEMIHTADEIIFKEGGKEVKTLKKKEGQIYLQREALGWLYQHYDFSNLPAIHYYQVGFDKKAYYMELSYIGKETITIDEKQYDCFRLMDMPGGTGKIFAAKYKNYYLFASDPPHHYLRYENDFMPMKIDVVKLNPSH